MQRLARSQRLFLAYISFVGLSSLLVLSRIISSPSEQANAILFGFSTPRLLMALGLFFVLAFCTMLALRAMKDQAWSAGFLEKWFEEKGNGQRVGWLSGIGFGLGWIGCFLPAYRVSVLGNYWARVQPAMTFILLASLATLIMFFVVKFRLTIRNLNLASLTLGLPLFIVSLFVLGGMFYSGFGVTSSEDFWYGAGVPILTTQLMAVVIGGILFMHFEPRWQSKQADVLICAVIYVLTAYLWAHEPLRESFFFVHPGNLNQEFYPYSDASTFDTASQFPLIGKNFLVFNSVFFERPLYLSFLVYLHSLFGQDYERLMAVQAGVFASLPVLIYLIGKSLNVRAVGFASAIVVMLRGINSISASNMIDMANPKMMLTDFPTAIGLALVVLFICEWLKEPEQNRHYPAWIGGAIGFTLMLRTNALLLLVFVPLYVWFGLPKSLKRWWLGSGLIFLGFVAITLPWEIRNLSLGGQMYGPMVRKFQDVIEERYLPAFQPGSFLPKDQGSVSTTLGKPLLVSMPIRISETIQGDQACSTVVCFSSKHFLHNIITSILILPTSPILDDLGHLIKDVYPYYWKAKWDGTFEGIAPLFLVLNLFFITSGITLAWREKRLAGLTPLAIFVVYDISNGLARTSGGRYIVPIDWIVFPYYLLGVFYVVTWIANIGEIQWNIFPTPSGQGWSKPGTTGSFSKTLFVLAILLGFGGLIPLSENLYMSRYRNVNPQEILTNNQSLVEEAGLNPHDLDEFAQSPKAGILLGRALYPRYFKMNRGDLFFYPFVAMGFPRTAFKLVGPSGEYSVVLPGDAPQYFPHASDVLVLGCNGKNYFDALVVIVLGDNGKIYTRSPESKLQCPLQQPVCDNNSACQ